MPMAPEQYSPSVILKANKHFDKARHYFDMAFDEDQSQRLLSLAEDSHEAKGRKERKLNLQFNSGVTRNLNLMKNAERHLIKGLKLYPLNAEAWWMLAVASHEGFKQEILYCNNALEIDPDYAQAWATKSNILRMSKQEEEAEQCKQRAIELGFPSNRIFDGLSD